MKFFLFWLGLGLAGIAQSLLLAAVGAAQPGKGEAVGLLFGGLITAGAAWLVMLAWAQTHQVTGRWTEDLSRRQRR